MVYHVYRYRSGYSLPGIDAQTVGEAIATMQDARGGRITPRDVVDESRPDDAPLHGAFTWDDAAAAEKCREDEARRVIRSYAIVKTDEQGRQREEIANVSVALPYSEDGPAYMPTMTALENPELRARVLALAKAQLDGWLARYGHFEELAGIAEAIRRAKEATANRPAPRHRAARRPQPAAPAAL